MIDEISDLSDNIKDLELAISTIKQNIENIFDEGIKDDKLVSSLKGVRKMCDYFEEKFDTFYNHIKYIHEIS